MGETGHPSNTYYRTPLKYCLSQATTFTLFLADKAGFWRRNSGFEAHVTRLRAELSGLLQPLGPVAYPVLLELLLRLRAPVPGVHPQELELLSKSRVYAAVRAILRRSPVPALGWCAMGTLCQSGPTEYVKKPAVVFRSGNLVLRVAGARASLRVTMVGTPPSIRRCSSLHGRYRTLAGLERNVRGTINSNPGYVGGSGAVDGADIYFSQVVHLVWRRAKWTVKENGIRRLSRNTRP